MNTVKCAIISILRQPAKSVTLFILLFILGNLMMGALVIQQAVSNTEMKLMASIPPVATLIQDWAWILSVPIEEQLEYSTTLFQESIHEVGRLPYVSTFNIKMETSSSDPLLSQELVRSEELSLDMASLTEMDRNRITDPWSVSNFHGVPEGWDTFFLRGIYFSEKMADINSGLMSIAEGRTFTSEELTSSAPVALISRQLAQVNGLQVGDNLPLRNGISHFGELLSQKEIHLEVVGIFDLDTNFFDYENNFHAFEDEFRQINRIHVPLGVVEAIERYNFEINQKLDPWFLDFQFEDLRDYNSIFILNDIHDLSAFIESARSLLPPNWMAEGLATYVFGSLDASMQNISWVMETVLSGAVAASITVTSLLILLFIKDRKKEIGIYLALGKRKIGISSQILLEVSWVAILALTLSLFSGNLLAEGLSQHMLATEVAHYEQQRISARWGSMNDPHDLLIYSPPRMSQEEMVEAFDLSVSTNSIVLYYLIGMGTIWASIALPMVYLMKINPKKILM